MKDIFLINLFEQIEAIVMDTGLDEEECRNAVSEIRGLTMAYDIYIVSRKTAGKHD